MGSFKITFRELEHAVRTVENAMLRASSDQHFEDVVGFRTAANVLRSVALEIESPPVQRAPRPVVPPSEPEHKIEVSGTGTTPDAGRSHW